MSRNRAILLAVVVVLFVAAGAFFVVRGTGGGGRDVSLDLKVTGANMQPSDPSARLNDRVTMTVTTDKDEEIHLHGYDIAFECKAGKPLTKTFKADKTGPFEIEIEDTSQKLGQLTVNP